MSPIDQTIFLRTHRLPQFCYSGKALQIMRLLLALIPEFSLARHYILCLFSFCVPKFLAWQIQTPILSKIAVAPTNPRTFIQETTYGHIFSIALDIIVPKALSHLCRAINREPWNLWAFGRIFPDNVSQSHSEKHSSNASLVVYQTLGRTATLARLAWHFQCPAVFLCPTQSIWVA